MDLFGEWGGIFRRPRFKILALFVTNRCDARCASCFYWKNLNAPVNFLTLEEYGRIAAQAPPVEHLLLSGGEPTLAPDLVEIVRTFIREPWQSISLPTNGLKTERVVKQTRAILEARPDNALVVGVSIDGLERLNDEIRGVPGIYRAALRTLEELAALKPAFPNLRLTTLTTVMDANQDEAGDLLREIDRLGYADFYSVELLRGNHPKESLGPPDRAKAAEIQRTCNALSYARLRKNNPDEAALMLSHIRALNREQLHVMRAGRLRIDCLAGRVAAVLERNGDARLCELLDPIGNVRDFDYDFHRALRSPAALAQLRFIKSRDCSCTHCVNVGQSVPFDPRSEIRRILERRRIVKTGQLPKE